jgi:4-hydroxybenzoate polyprenyltransferase
MVLRLPGLMLVSAALYASGLVFNDCLDAEKDLVSRPDRPIPSGAVPLGRAYLLGLGLTLGALAAAMALGLPTVIYAGLLVAGIWLHNGVMRRWVVTGAVAMGLCRFLNMQLGMSTGQSLPYFNFHEYSVLVWAPLLLGAYSALLSVAAAYEDQPADRLGWWVLLAAAAGLFTVPLLACFLVVGSLGGWVVMALLSVALAGNFSMPVLRPTFESIRRAVGLGVVLIIAFDAAVILGTPGVPVWWGLGTLALLLPAWWLARRFSPS